MVASVDVIGGNSDIFSLGFGGAIAAHAVLAVLALWLLGKALPARAAPTATPEVAEQGET